MTSFEAIFHARIRNIYLKIHVCKWIHAYCAHHSNLLMRTVAYLCVSERFIMCWISFSIRLMCYSSKYTLFYKNLLYKNVEAEKGQNLRTSQERAQGWNLVKNKFYFPICCKWQIYVRNEKIFIQILTSNQHCHHSLLTWTCTFRLGNPEFTVIPLFLNLKNKDIIRTFYAQIFEKVRNVQPQPKN